MKLNPRNYFFILLGILALIVAGTFAGLYYADNYLVEKADKISNLKAEDEILGQKLESAETTRENLNELAFVQELAADVLPDAKNQSEVILLISKIADEVGVSTETFSFSSTEGDPSDTSQTTPLEGTVGVLVLPITTSFTSTYNQLINFLERTELNKRKMQISNISINPRLNNEGESTGVLDIQLTINAYVKG